MSSSLRQAALAAASSTAAVLAAASPAFAVGGGTNPSTNPPVFPGTTTAVDAWKLVGTGAASNVQVAPRWVISSAHAGLGVGKTFTSPTGATSKVIAYWQPGPRPGATGYAADISLSLLETPIAAPAGGFPRLLSEPTNLELGQVLPGNVLWAGQGGSTTTPIPTAGWAKPDGRPAGGSPILRHIGGDSGSTGFLYPSATAKPIIAGVVDWAKSAPVFGVDAQYGAPLGQAGSQTYATIGDWVRQQVASRPEATPPTWTTWAGAGVPLTGLKPIPPREISVQAATPTSTTLAWRNTTETRVPRTAYRVRVSPGGATFNLAASAQSYTVTGLSANTAYTFTVKAVNANGESPVGRLTTNTDTSVPDEPDSVTYRTRANPNPVQNLTVVGERANGLNTVSEGGSGKSGLDYCLRAKWAAPVAISGTPITRYEVTFNGRDVSKTVFGGHDYSLDPDKDGGFSLRRCGLQPGASGTFSVRARSDANIGASATASGTAPTGAPAGTPFAGPSNLTVTTRRATAFGKVDYCADAKWTTPPTIDGVPLQRYSALVHTTNYSDVFGIEEIAPTATSRAICGLQPDREYKVTVYANYAYGFSGGSDTLFDTPTGAAPGTSFSAATGVTAKGFVANNLGKVDYCVSFSWDPPTTVDGFPIADYQALVHSADFSYLKSITGIPAGAGRRSNEQCGLQPGVEYSVTIYSRFTVTATTKLSTATPAMNVSTPAGAAPGTAWTSPTITGVSQTTVNGERCATVAWNPPAPVAGHPVTAYTVLLHNGSYSYIAGSQTLPESARSYRQCGVPGGDELKVVVYASFGANVVTSAETLFDTV